MPEKGGNDTPEAKFLCSICLPLFFSFFGYLAYFGAFEQFTTWCPACFGAFEQFTTLIYNSIHIRECYPIPFYHPKKLLYQLYHTILQYFQYLNFYFTILHIKIIYLHNKIIYLHNKIIIYFKGREKMRHAKVLQYCYKPCK